MGLGFKSFFGLSEEQQGTRNDTEDAFSENEAVAKKSNQTSKVISMQGNVAAQNHIVVFEPRIYSDVKEIANLLLNTQAVIVNFSRLDEEQSKRVVDFVTGTVFAINGDIQRIGSEIFLCTPANFVIEGVSADYADQTDK